MVYDKLVEGHCGGKKMNLRLSKNFYWPNMLQDYKNQSKTCKIYQKTKVEKVGKYGKLIPIESPKRI